ncbi:uncharacterized protein LOC144170295 [Haemaphysalis longicornis]|uniref:Uncharacterized protein n=1 Tax=Haemaphysalis longicornis TaxID=44386 RepID=A0A9J6G448_HAELO|nr:hypothetical protein HPB48_001890 [Haemaphysalis longicornis]
MAAARSKSADDAPPADGGGASALAGGRGPTTPLRMLKRTVVQETVSKSVTERKESTKQVTDQATGVERRRDSHIETSTTEEVRSKRQEETVESYDGAPLAATSQPILGALGQFTSAPGPESAADTARKNVSPKHPVAIRVQDDNEETLTIKTPEAPPAPVAVPSILRTTSSHEDSEHKHHPHKLEFQEEEEYHRAPLVKPPADLAQRFANVESKQDEDDDEPAEPPPSRFNMRRKDSIAVAKLRMLRQQEEGASANSEEEAEEDAPETQNAAGSPDKKHPSFRPPTVIAIVPEQPDEESAADVPDPGEPKSTTGPPVEAPLAPDPGHTVTESRTQIDSQVTSTEKELVNTYANEIVTTKDTDEVAKKTRSEVTTESAQLPLGALVPRENSAAAIVATVVDDVSANVKTPMDK